MRSIHLSEDNRRELTHVAAAAAGWTLDGPTLEAVRDRARSSESLRAVGDNILGGLRQDGFCLMRNVPSGEDAELAVLLGLVAIPSALGNGDTLFFDIAPRSAGSTDISGTGAEFPLHTDSTFLSAPHDVLGLACRQNSSDGGESIVIAAADVATRIRSVGGPAVLAALGEPVYPFYLRDPLVGHGTQRVPILAPDGGEWRMRYRGDVVDALIDRFTLTDGHQRALAVLDQVLTDPALPRATVRLETDDLLLIDNRRMLHARTAVGPGDRHLRRIKGYLLHTAAASFV